MARLPSTPKEPRAQFSIGLPSDYESRKAAFLDEFEDIATERYGPGKKFSGVVRLALDELWRRRSEVRSKASDAFEQVGLTGLLPMALDHSFSRQLVRSETIFLVIDDFLPWLRTNDHDRALEYRLSELKLPTHIILPTHDSDLVATPELSADNEYAAKSLLKHIAFDPDDNYPLRILAHARPRYSKLPFVLMTDDTCYFAPSFESIQASTAFVYEAGKGPGYLTFSRELHDLSATDSNLFWNWYKADKPR
ncbi:MAG: hypothetical protein J0I79_16380 [Mesorhizobium sp.]|uniref:hypothetical protein n=1 Tax=Mesorhizobium sp. TaxID=1871066 RepID=UPI001AC1595C|nr:hypothetical protein [Mesorhizobium sp.]MBN9219523.1 hypothetical protein [Mesorhizobium sp.]